MGIIYQTKFRKDNHLNSIGKCFAFVITLIHYSRNWAKLNQTTKIKRRDLKHSNKR